MSQIFVCTAKTCSEGLKDPFEDEGVAPARRCKFKRHQFFDDDDDDSDAVGIGASEGIRTLDIHVGNVTLYQTELRSLPKKCGYGSACVRHCKRSFSCSRVPARTRCEAGFAQFPPPARLCLARRAELC